MSRWLGSILVLISATSFGFMPLFGSWASEVSVPMKLMLRFGIATAVLGCVAGTRGSPMPRGRVLLALFAMGAVGYFGESFLYFVALGYAPSGMVSLLLYTYPAVVTVLSVTILKERLTGSKIVALGLAVAGSALTVIPGLFGEGHHKVQLVGVALGLTCSMAYALYVLAGAKLPKTVGALPSAVLVCAGATTSYALALVVSVVIFHHTEVFPTTARAWTGIVGLGLVCTVIGVALFLAGLARVGPVRASTLSSFEPVMTAGVGIVALGDEFNWVQIVGGVLIVCAAALSARSKEPEPTPAGAVSSTS